MKDFITVIGIILTFVGYAPYLKNTFTGKTKPHIFSWFVWGLVTLIAFLLQMSDNAGPGALITLAAALICFVIIIIGIKKGTRDIVKSDFIFLILAVVAIGLWLLVKQPLLSAILVCLIDMLGFVPTIRKSWNKPHEETAFTYGLNCFRHLLSIFALTNYTAITMLYPLSWSLANGLFTIMLVVRRKQIKKDELLDLVNEHDEIIGTVWKSQAHQDPKLIHREVAIVIFNDQKKTLLQRRSMNKTNGPGSWKVAAAGHVEHGEEPAIAIRRELREELGLEVEPVFFKKIFQKYQYREARFTWCYYAVVKGEPKIILERDEVMDYAWVNLDELEAFSKEHDYDLQGTSHLVTMEITSKIFPK
jgi:isopentenyl-diphosphate delta-isomerase type 1